MKKLFKSIKRTKAGMIAGTAVTRMKTALVCTRAEGFVDTAIKVLMAVVIGALVLAGLYALFGSTIMPTVTERVREMFNFTGS